MKTAFILFFLLVLLGIEAKAGAPYGIKGQEQSTLYSNVHQFANKQVTNLGGINALVQDCGSSANLFENCGYEAGPTSTTTITGWTLTAGTMVAETTDVKQGKKSLKLEMTSDALDFYQTSTLNVTAFADGVNGSISLAIKTTVDNVYLCRTDSAGAVVASTDGTKITNCVKVSNSGKWGDYVLPVILGATSNGMRLVSLTPSTAAAVAITGDVYVDQGILEAGLKTAIVSNIGPWTTFASPANPSNIGTATGSYAYYRYRQNGQNIDVDFRWNATAAGSGATGITFPLPTGITVENGLQIDKAGSATVYNVVGSSTAFKEMGISANGSSATISNTGVGGNLTGADLLNGTQIRGQFSAKADQFTNSSSVYTVPSDSFSTDTNTLAHKTTAIVAADPIGTYNTYSYAINTNTKTICGSVPSILPNSADGFKIFTRAYNAPSTCGNPARVEIKIGAAGTKFPTIKTDIYKSVGKVTSGSLDNYTESAGATIFGAAYNGYDESTGILIVDTGISGASGTNHFIIFSDVSSQTSGYLVINAQKAKDSIVGSFNEVTTSEGITKPVIYSFYVSSTGVVSQDFSDFISGNCTNANPTVCTITSNKVNIAPNCSIIPDNVDRSFRGLSLEGSSISFTLFVSSTGAVVSLDTGGWVICHAGRN